MCPSCVNGTFWDPPSDDFDSQGTCRHCSEVMSGCTNCHSKSRCLSCEEGLFLNYQ